MEELKPCPFCGGKANIGSLVGDKENWAIWCKCGIACSETGVNGNTKEEAIKAWNTRVKTQQQIEDNERAQAHDKGEN